MPHLSKQQKDELLDAFPLHERDARAEGVPMLGSGRIYPIDEKQIVIDPFEIPDYWPKAYGLDVGWKITSAHWGAWDRESDIVYLYSEHYMGQQPPQVHADAIKQRGAWIWGAIDPASAGSNQKDGSKLIDEYRSLGLNLVEADNSVEAGILACYRRMSSGRLKVFRNCVNWQSEYRIYRRDEKGKVVKENDHALDACVVGDTCVVTDRGHEKISDLVGRSGRVLTRSGAMARFVGARKTLRDAPVVRVSFEDGREVVCTEDHPFLTPNGWRKACEMNGELCYDAVSQRIQASQWKSSFIPRHVRSLMGAAITSAENISRGMASAFIARCGRKLMGQLHLASTSTIGMRIAPTIPLAIWSSSQPQNTSVITRSAFRTRLLRQLSMQPSFGTAAQREGLGTLSIITQSLASFMSRQIFGVINAVRSSSLGKLDQIVSALMGAKPSTGLPLGLITRNVFAWFVASVSWQIAMFLSRRAHANALVRCKAVQSAGRSDVYCLTVPGVSAFAVSDGLVVHNTRYLVMTGMLHACLPPEDAEDDPWSRNRGRSMDTGY